MSYCSSLIPDHPVRIFKWLHSAKKPFFPEIFFCDLHLLIQIHSVVINDCLYLSSVTSPQKAVDFVSRLSSSVLFSAKRPAGNWHRLCKMRTVALKTFLLIYLTGSKILSYFAVLTFATCREEDTYGPLSRPIYSKPVFPFSIHRHALPTLYHTFHKSGVSVRKK